MEESVVKQFDKVPSGNSIKSILLPAGIILAIILAGVGVGYFWSQRGSATGSLLSGQGTGGGLKLGGAPKVAGVKDEKAFPDATEGRLEVNDQSLVNEGSHRLIRPGGVSNIAYLTSSSVDLNKFVGHCVKIWGQTFTAQKAGWLLDVGYVERLDKCPEGL